MSEPEVTERIEPVPLTREDIQESIKTGSPVIREINPNELPRKVLSLKDIEQRPADFTIKKKNIVIMKEDPLPQSNSNDKKVYSFQSCGCKVCQEYCKPQNNDEIKYNRENVLQLIARNRVKMIEQLYPLTLNRITEKPSYETEIMLKQLLIIENALLNMFNS